MEGVGVLNLAESWGTFGEGRITGRGGGGGGGRGEGSGRGMWRGKGTTGGDGTGDEGSGGGIKGRKNFELLSRSLEIVSHAGLFFSVQISLSKSKTVQWEVSGCVFPLLVQSPLPNSGQLHSLKSLWVLHLVTRLRFQTLKIIVSQEMGSFLIMPFAPDYGMFAVIGSAGG